MKKMLLLIVFIMFFVGISCVSAENMNEIGASSSDDVISLDDDSNFIVAKEVNETNLNTDSFEINNENSISSSYNTNLQELNQNDIVKTDELLKKSNNQSNRILKEDNDGNGLLGDGVNLKHIYVSPNGNGSGLDENTPGDFITILKNIEDNTVIHMLNGNYTLLNITPYWDGNFYHYIKIESKNNISIIGENPDKVKIIFSKLNQKKYRPALIFSLINNNNFKFENITFSATKDDPKIRMLRSYFWLNRHSYIFENCRFINARSEQALMERCWITNLTINNCYFTSTDGELIGYEIMGGVDGIVLINNTIFKNCCRYPDGKLILVGNCSIFNSQFLEYENNYLIDLYGGNLTIENNTFDRPYIITLTEDYGTYPNCKNFRSHSTLTFLNGEDSVNVTCGDVINLNASLVDDSGNILSLYKLRFTLFEKNLAYTKGVYNMEVTVPDVPGEYYLDVNDEMFTKYLGNCTVKIPTFIVKEAPTFTFEDKNNSIYGEEVIINIDSPDIKNGKLTFTFNNTKIIKNFTNNHCSINLGVLPAGKYTINAYYAGDETFGAKSYSKTYEVNKAESTITLTKNKVNAIKENGEVGFYFSLTEIDNENTIGIILPNNATGKLTFKINNNTKIIDINKRKVLLGTLDNGNYTITVKYNGDNNYNESEEYNFTLINNKPNVNLTLNYNNISYTNPFNINVTLNQNVVKNTILFEVRDLEGNLINSTTGIINNKIASATFTGLNAGEYNIIAIYEGDETYCNSIVSQRFKVDKSDLESFTLKTEKTISIYDNIKVEALIPVNVTGTVTFRLNGYYEITADLSNNHAEAIFNSLSEGNYTIYAIFNGDNNYNPHEENINISVVKADVNLNISVDDVDWGNDLVVVVKTDPRFTGNASVKLDDLEKIVEITEGIGNATFTNLKAGTYTIVVRINETEFFNSTQKNTTVTVNKVNSTLTLGDEIIFNYGETGLTTVEYTGATNITAEVTDHPEATISIENNKIIISNLNAGKYTLKVTTIPDENHNSIYGTINITVNKVNAILDIRNEIIYNYGGVGYCDIYSIGVDDLILSIVDHPEAIIHINENGIVNLTGLNAGSYILEVVAVPDNNHNQVTGRTNVTVNKIDSKLTIPNIIFNYGESGNVTANVSNATGLSNVSVIGHPEADIKINGFKIIVSGLNIGTYTLTATTIVDNNYNPVTVNTNIVVNKLPTVISVNNVNTVYDSSGKIIVTLKDINGNTLSGESVTVKVGSISKTLITNAKGQVSVNVASLVPKNYIASIIFAGNDKLNMSSNTAKVTINKATPKLTTKTLKTKTKTKIKKVTITLKNNGKSLKKVKVTLKIKGKLYKAKTNNKGVAKFKVTKLNKKGTYKGTVKFTGNTYFKAVSKKVKIIVKK